jgi:putative YphP/YqiW family bacilliredoxin
MYPEEMVAPMRRELTDIGFSELLDPQAVDNALDTKEGTTFLMINSVCGCAAGAARPGVKKALMAAEKKPGHLVTVFAGVDKDAVDQARTYTLPYPPSSPCMAIFKEGKLVHFIERHQIEGNTADMIGDHLKKVFEHYC